MHCLLALCADSTDSATRLPAVSGASAARSRSASTRLEAPCSVSELLTHRVREKLKGSLAAGSRDGNGTRKRAIPDEALDQCLPYPDCRRLIDWRRRRRVAAVKAALMGQRARVLDAGRTGGGFDIAG